MLAKILQKYHAFIHRSSYHIITISFANSHKIAPVHLPLIGLRTESEDGRLVPLGRRVEQLGEPIVSMVMIMIMMLMLMLMVMVNP